MHLDFSWLVAERERGWRRVHDVLKWSLLGFFSSSSEDGTFLHYQRFNIYDNNDALLYWIWILRVFFTDNSISYFHHMYSVFLPFVCGPLYILFHFVCHSRFFFLLVHHFFFAMQSTSSFIERAAILVISICLDYVEHSHFFFTPLQ